jgi:hypothetical protein
MKLFHITREPEGATFLGGAPAADPGAAPAAAGAAGVGDGSQPPVNDGPPEWLPPKYWDAEKKAPRTEDLGRGYMSLEKFLGSEKVPVPTNWDDPEQVERWYKAAGRPEKPDDYEFKRPDKLPEGLPYDEETEKNFRTWAHINGFSKKQAGNMYEAYVKTQIERHAHWQEAQQRQRGELEASLVREHGGNVEAVKQRAFGVMQQYADGEFRQFLDTTGLGNDPRMVRFLANVAKAQGGETRLQGRAPPAANPADMKKQISEYRAQHEKALMNKTHPDHDMRTKEFQAMYQNAYPDMPKL